MEYAAFTRLLRLKLDISRKLHQAGPRENHTLRRCVDAVSSRLQTDSDFQNNIRRYRHELGRIG